MVVVVVVLLLVRMMTSCRVCFLLPAADVTAFTGRVVS